MLMLLKGVAYCHTHSIMHRVRLLHTDVVALCVLHKYIPLHSYPVLLVRRRTMGTHYCAPHSIETNPHFLCIVVFKLSNILALCSSCLSLVSHS